MPSKVPNVHINVHREGRTVGAPPGKPFDFTDEEVQHITSVDPDHLRDPVNEGGREPDADRERDANRLAASPAKAGGSARYQGGSLEEGMAGAPSDQIPRTAERSAASSSTTTTTPSRSTTARQPTGRGGKSSGSGDEDDEL